MEFGGIQGSSYGWDEGRCRTQDDEVGRPALDHAPLHHAPPSFVDIAGADDEEAMASTAPPLASAASGWPKLSPGARPNSIFAPP
eukprot:scaffold176831_cov35-Tisochrysis_lutea.AAC.2